MATTLIEVVRRAAATQQAQQQKGDAVSALPLSKCSLTLNANAVIRRLLSTISAQEEKEKKTTKEPPLPLPLRRLPPWEMDGKDTQVLRAESKLLNRMKSVKPQDLTPKSFLALLNPFLLDFQQAVGVSPSPNGKISTLDLLQKLARCLPRDAVNEIVRFSVGASFWKPLEVLLSCGVVPCNSCGGLVDKLTEAKRMDILCLYVENMLEIRPPELLLILRYFLRPPGDDKTVASVRQKRKMEALAAVETAVARSRRKTVEEENGKLEFGLRQTAVLVAAAVDGFSAAEFCLHYVVCSSIDENVLGWVVGRLDSAEVLKLLRYLGKWLRKYSGCHLTGPSDIFPSVNVARWVPSLASVMKWICVILDEGYSTLVLRAEFHDELKSVDEIVKDLVESASGGCSLVSIVEMLRSDAKLPNINRFKADEEHLVQFLELDGQSII